MISEDIILRIKEENDIVDVISDDVRLQRAGSNYKGLCPFHGEKTASFIVSREKQIYKCFGCGEAGNVITYIMKTKNKSFPEACETLADRVGIEIPQFRKADDALYEKRKRLFEVNTQAAREFYKNLTVENNAKSYFSKRGINEKMIKKFGLGFAKDSWFDLINKMKKQGYTQEELLDAGLISESKKKKGSFYDKFRNRIIFPVFNVKGYVIGFGGRVMDDSLPKYLNSPETLIFKKGINLYGLNFAIKEKDILSRKIIIVEGYMDVLALQQNGITNVAASLGTAFTNEQAKLLKRYVDTVILSFDSDSAGRRAAERSIEILKKSGLEIKILRIPEGKDPDEYLKNHGRNEFLKLVNESYSLMEYEVLLESEKYDIATQDGKIKFLKSSARILTNATPIEREIYVKRISEITGINEQRVYDQINVNLKKREKNFSIRNESGKNSQNLYLEPAFLKAEKTLLKFMLKKELYADIMGKIEVNEFNSDIHKTIIGYMKEAFHEGQENITEYIESRVQDTKVIGELVLINESEIEKGENSPIQIQNCISEIRKHNSSVKREALLKEMKEKEKKGDIMRCLEIAAELKKFEK